MPEIGVEIQAIDNTGRGIKNAEKSMGRLKGAVRGVTSAAKLAAFGIGGIAIAGAGIGVALATQFIGAGKELQRFANRTGHTVEQLSAMSYAAERAGLDLEDMVDVTEEMRIKANDVSSGIKTYATFFEELGINAAEYLKLSPDEQFNLTAESLKNVEDATRRTIIADELLSDTGKRLLQVTQSNADGFAGLAAEAEAAGRIMGTDTVSSIARMNGALGELKDRGLGLALKAFESVAPVLADAAESAIAFVDETLPKIIEWGTEVFDKFGDAKDKVGEVIDAFKNGGLLGAIKEAIDPASDKVKDLNSQLVELGDGSMTYTDNPVLSGLKGETDGLVVPITTYKEALEALNTAPQYTGNPVIEGLQGDIAEIAATLDPGLKEILQGFSAADTALTGDLQEIADTIPLISQAFVDETPAITAAISGYTAAAGEIEEVGTTVGDVRDKVDLNVRAMAARLGPFGFPIVALWSVIQGNFATGRETTVAEVVQMNSDLDIQIGGSTATGGTLGGLAIAAGLMKVAWGVVSDVFGGGSKDTVAEVEGMNTDLGTETTATVDELNAFETLLGPQWTLIKEVFGVGRDETVAEMMGFNTDIADQFDITKFGLALTAGLLTGNWDLVAGAFEMGRKDSAAEVEGLNTDLETKTFQTLEVIDVLGRDASDNWDGVTFTFEQARINTVAEVTDLNKELETETANTTRGISLWQLLLAGEWGNVVTEFHTGRTNTEAEVTGFNSFLGKETGKTTTELSTWASEHLGPGWQLVVDAFNLGRTDSVAEVTALNTGLDTPTDAVNTKLGTTWRDKLAASWLSIKNRFSLGRTGSITQIDLLNTGLDTPTEAVNTKLGTTWRDKLAASWLSIKNRFSLGRTGSITQIDLLNTGLDTPTEAVNTKLGTTWRDKLAASWLSIKNRFSLGRTGSITQIDLLNTGLDTPTEAVNTKLGTTWRDKLAASWLSIKNRFSLGRTGSITQIDLLNTGLDTPTEAVNTKLGTTWRDKLAASWLSIKNRFSLGRTGSITQIDLLNTGLDTPTEAVNTKLGTTWRDKLGEVWVDLTGEFTTGKDNSIEEIKGISLYLGEETAGGTGTAASGVDAWGLVLHQRFQDFKNLVQGPIDAIVGVINRIKNAVQSAIDAINRLRQERSVPLPAFNTPASNTPRSAGGAPGPATGGIGGGGGGPIPNDPQALAGGGIVTRPTFALIGEAGPEAIIPLGRGGGVGSTIVVNVNIEGSVVSEHELETRIHRTVNSALSAGAIA